MNDCPMLVDLFEDIFSLKNYKLNKSNYSCIPCLMLKHNNRINYEEIMNDYEG